MRELVFQKVLQTETVQQASFLGERVMTPDGRGWIYVKANEDVTIHKALTRIANSNVDTVSSSSDGAGNRVFIKEISAGWTAGQFQNAYGIVDAGTGVGQFFKIKDNTVDTLELYPDYALGTALDVTDSDIVIVRPHLAELTATSTLHQIPVGIAQVAYTQNDFAWALERGVGAVTQGGTVFVANELCTPGDDTEGTLLTVASTETLDDASSFGRAMVIGTEDEEGIIDVNLW